MSLAIDLSGAPSQPDAEATDETARRILDAALALFLEFGLRRTTMEDVARRTGVSRVTVYRHHADKASLFQAVILREYRRSVADIQMRLAGLGPDRDPLVEGFVLAVQGARRHPLIRRLLDTEPEWLLPYLTIKGAAMFELGKSLISTLLGASPGEGRIADRDIDMVSELLVRLIQSAVLTPVGVMASDKADDLRRVARRLIDQAA